MKTLDVYLYFNGVNSLFIISYCKYGFEKPICLYRIKTIIMIIIIIIIITTIMMFDGVLNKPQCIVERNVIGNMKPLF